MKKEFETKIVHGKEVCKEFPLSDLVGRKLEREYYEDYTQYLEFEGGFVLEIMTDYDGHITCVREKQL